MEENLLLYYAVLYVCACQSWQWAWHIMPPASSAWDHLASRPASRSLVKSHCMLLTYIKLATSSKLCHPLDTEVPLSPSSTIWYRPRGGDLFGWESYRGPGGK